MKSNSKSHYISRETRQIRGSDESPVYGPEDARYFDLGYFPEPAQGQNGIAARLAQVEAIQRRRSERDTIAYQIEARRKPGAAAGAAAGIGHNSPSKLPELFPELVPAKPYCANDLAKGLIIRSKSTALKMRHLQLNVPGIVRWIVHDLDYPCGGIYAYRDVCLPVPNIVVTNPTNGHAHGMVLLRTPVLVHSGARIGPLAYLAAIERGMARRLEADRGYVGLVAKNPFHNQWKVEWARDEPFTLHELDDSLHFTDKRPEPSISSTFGFGRNCTCFDAVRHVAYREVLDAKRAGSSESEFQDRLKSVAQSVNSKFSVPLPSSEIRAIAKSIAKWTWRKFSPEELSKRKSQLGKRGAAKRWAHHEAVEKTKPWEDTGISRSTWYRRRKICE